MGVGVVLVVVDSNDKYMYTKRRNVSNHEHLPVHYKHLTPPTKKPMDMSRALC